MKTKQELTDYGIARESAIRVFEKTNSLMNSINIDADTKDLICKNLNDFTVASIISDMHKHNDNKKQADRFAKKSAKAYQKVFPIYEKIVETEDCDILNEIIENVIELSQFRFFAIENGYATPETSIFDNEVIFSSTKLIISPHYQI